MKTIKNVLLVTVAGLFFIACKDTNSKEAATTESTEVKKEILAENLQTASFTVEGMHCEFGCAKSIEKKLAKLNGVKSALVDFETKQASIEYDATQETPQTLAKIVEEMADGDTYKVSGAQSSSDQSSLYLDKEKKKKATNKDKKPKKGKKSTADSADSKSTSDQPTEKKGKCCSSKSSCSSKSGNI